MKKLAQVLVVFGVGVILIFYFMKMRKNEKMTEPDTQAVEAVEKKKTDQTKLVEKPNKPASPTLSAVSTGELKKETSISPEQITQLRVLAKSTLANNFTAQMAFFAEYDRYTTDLYAAGYAMPSPQMKFKVGFLEPYNAEKNNGTLSLDENPERKDSDSFSGKVETQSGQKYEYDKPSENIDLAQFRHYCEHYCTAQSDYFEMMLAIPLGDAEHVDVWLIDSQKRITLVQDGMAQR